MRSSTALLVGIVALIAALAAGEADDVWVRITEPRDGAYVIGDVEIVAEVVTAQALEGVEFRVDGRSVGLVTSPPYRMQLDLGSGNTSHRFEVVARSTAGEEARDSVATEPVPISSGIDVELQQLYVTVTGQDGRVLDLQPEDFEVLDERVPQRLITFEIGDVPLTAMLLIDSSLSMAGAKLQAAMQGVAVFVGNMKPLDQVKLMFFSDRLLSTSQFTRAGGVELERLATTSATGGTALYDHLFVALKQIEQRQGRRVIIFLSDGVDSHSALDMEAVTKVARRSQAQIHWIRMRRGSGDEKDDDRARIWSSWRTAEENRDQLNLLKRVVTRSGGDTRFIHSIDQIEGVFLDILLDLREQYVLGYYPTNHRDDGAWHNVRVRVSKPGVEIRAARGYVDF